MQRRHFRHQTHRGLILIQWLQMGSCKDQGRQTWWLHLTKDTKFTIQLGTCQYARWIVESSSCSWSLKGIERHWNEDQNLSCTDDVEPGCRHLQEVSSHSACLQQLSFRCSTIENCYHLTKRFKTTGYQICVGYAHIWLGIQRTIEPQR